MFRNQYDQHNTLWSPQGRLFQVEYAMEAVKQGSCAVGIVGKEHAIVATLHRTQSELSSTLNKIFKVDDNMGIAISGVAADGRVMCKVMRSECLNHKFIYESEMPVGRLVRIVADKNQYNTLYGHMRPYGLGLLVIGADANGPCLWETSPSGEFWQCKAMALGARSQAAKTYLERNLDSLEAASSDDLIKHVLLALQASQQEGEITKSNVAVAIVGKDQPFTMLEGETLAPFVAQIEAEQPAEGGDGVEGGAAAAGGAGVAEAGAAGGAAEGGDAAQGGNGEGDGAALMED